MNAVVAPHNGVEVQLQLFELFQSRFGWDIPPAQLDSLASAAREIAERCGFDSVGQYLELLERLPAEAPLLQVLLQARGRREAHFFRDEASTRSLRELVLPALIGRLRPRRTLRIWGAGCSTGEDLYSILFLLHEIISDIEAWDIALIGTDVDAAAVEVARRAEYAPDALRELSEPMRTRYFERTAGGRYRVRARYRHHVHFAVHNLAGHRLADPVEFAPWSGDFDLISGREVTAHLNAQARETVRNKFAALLRPGGVWIAAPSDPVPTLGFETVAHPGVFEHYPEGCRPASSAAMSTRGGAGVDPGRVTAGAEPSGYPSEDERPTWRPSPAPPSNLLRPRRAPPSTAGSTTASARAEAGRGGLSGWRTAETDGGAVPEAGPPPLNLDAALESARGLADHGQLERALRVVDTAISGLPDAAEAYLLRAKLHELAGHHERALANLRRVTRLCPSCADAYLQLGLLMLRGGSLEAAVSAFRAALVLGDAQRETYADVRRVAARHLKRALAGR